MSFGACQGQPFVCSTGTADDSCEPRYDCRAKKQVVYQGVESLSLQFLITMISSRESVTSPPLTLLDQDGNQIAHFCGKKDAECSTRGLVKLTVQHILDSVSS